MAFDFTGKRVWVTGAGRGIGREVATQFVAAGASVVGLDLAFPEADYPYATRLLDIGDSQAVNACCAALLADGGLDTLEVDDESGRRLRLRRWHRLRIWRRAPRSPAA